MTKNSIQESPTAAPLLRPFDYAGVRITDGRLRDQVEHARAFYLSIPDDNILKGFREQAGLPAPGVSMGGWCSNTTEVVFGQWLSGLICLFRATGDAALREKAVALMDGWAQAWKTGRLTCNHYSYDKYVGGLVDMAAYGNATGAIPLLAALTDWAEANLKRDRLDATDEDSQGGFFNGQLEWYTLPENLYRAYRLTGDERYRRFAEVWHYPAYWEQFNGNRTPAPHGLHGYSHANALCSAILAAVVNADAELLAAVIRAYDYFQETQCYLTGGYGPGEKLMRPDGTLGESLETEPNEKHLGGIVGRSFEAPCGTWAGFKITRYLIEHTGNARYGDWAERLLYNGIGASLPPRRSGHSFYYADYRIGGGVKRYFGDPWPCCSGTYLQDVAEYHNLIYFRDESPTAPALYTNLYVPSEVNWEQGGQNVTLTQRTRYPEAETVEFVIGAERPFAMTFRFRVPGWSGGITTEVNALPFAHEERDEWAAVGGVWNGGDRITLRIPLLLRAVPVDRRYPDRVAFAAGPVVLVRTRETLSVGTDAGGDALTDAVTPLGAVAEGASPRFRLHAQSAGVLVPFYSVGQDTPYAMYFDARDT